MRIFTTAKTALLTIAALGIPAPLAAANLDALAKTVLDRGAILKKAEATCGPAAVLKTSDSLTLTYARAAAEQKLPISRFTALDQAAEAEAVAAAQSAKFCTETKKKKASLLRQIKKAGNTIVKQPAVSS